MGAQQHWQRHVDANPTISAHTHQH
ncbi:uncharacterized protein G2W53_016769 [Senna tora]|uniref:Uncharacterized protein n=1 Tax=Senna tora TaxID=362788 RepID=A0A834WJK4_9FABA|nr:uncharacterized protein G2W53_016769 [Senna tora]